MVPLLATRFFQLFSEMGVRTCRAFRFTVQFFYRIICVYDLVKLRRFNYSVSDSAAQLYTETARYMSGFFQDRAKDSLPMIKLSEATTPPR